MAALLLIFASLALASGSRLPTERSAADGWKGEQSVRGGAGADAGEAEPSCGALALLQRSASLMRGGRVLRSIGGRDLSSLLSAAPDDDDELEAVLFDSTSPNPVAAPKDMAEEVHTTVALPLDGEDPSDSDWLGDKVLEEAPPPTPKATTTSPPPVSSSTQADTATTAAGSLLPNASSTTTTPPNFTSALAARSAAAGEFLTRVSFSGDLMAAGEAKAAVRGPTTEEAVASAPAERQAGIFPAAASPLPSDPWPGPWNLSGVTNISKGRALAAAADLASLWGTEMAAAARRDSNRTLETAVPGELLDECEAGLHALATLLGGQLPPTPEKFDMKGFRGRAFCAGLAERLAVSPAGPGEGAAFGEDVGRGAASARPRADAAAAA